MVSRGTGGGEGRKLAERVHRDSSTYSTPTIPTKQRRRGAGGEEKGESKKVSVAAAGVIRKELETSAKRIQTPKPKKIRKHEKIEDSHKAKPGRNPNKSKIRGKKEYRTTRLLARGKQLRRRIESDEDTL